MPTQAKAIVGIDHAYGESYTCYLVKRDGQWTQVDKKEYKSEKFGSNKKQNEEISPAHESKRLLGKANKRNSPEAS